MIQIRTIKQFWSLYEQHRIISFLLEHSFMDVNWFLQQCHLAVRHLKQHKHLMQLIAKLQTGLTLGLCSCMLWQCSTCLLKYMARPIGATVAYNTDLAQWAPIAITICTKEPNSTNASLQLAAVDVLQLEEGKKSEWKTIWRPLTSGESSRVRIDNFVDIFNGDKLRPCKTIHVHDSNPLVIRLQHYFNPSKACSLNKMEVYLHNRGLFYSQEYSLRLPKKMLTNEDKIILELGLETMVSLPSTEFNCTQDEEAMTLDTCLLTEACKAANQSAGCLAK
jgi:hypothetical protein